MKSTIELIGVYKIEDESNFYLFEMKINKHYHEINLSLFVQEDKKLSEDDWQVPYDEHYLNNDGTEIIDSQLINDALNPSDTRLTFFMYYENFNNPLKTPFGTFFVKEISPLPKRLSKIISFEPVD